MIQGKNAGWIYGLTNCFECKELNNDYWFIEERPFCQDCFKSRVGSRAFDCVNALAGIENPEAVKELIEAARDPKNHWHFMEDEQDALECSLCRVLKKLDQAREGKS